MKRGFTLVEVVMAVALSAFMLIALVNLFGSFNSLYDYQISTKGTADTSGAVIHAAERAVFPADAVVTTHTFSQGTYTSSASTLVLALPSIDSGGSVIPGQHDYVALYATTATAYRLVEVGVGSARQAGATTLGDHVVSLSFSYDNADVTLATQVTVDIQASTTVRQKPVASHMTETLRLRNK